MHSPETVLNVEFIFLTRTFNNVWALFEPAQLFPFFVS